MPKKTTILQISLIALASMLAYSNIGAQTQGRPELSNRMKVLKAAADALGMIRMSDIGAANSNLPVVDVVNTMHISASGIVYNSGQSSNVDYDAALAYIPPAMRVEIKRQGGGSAAPTIQTVREDYAWNESERGAGLVPGKGTATPVLADAKARLLQLWILPYGVVKAAIAAGDKTVVSPAKDSTVITFPLSGALAGITVTATLDSKNLVTKVVTKPDNPASSDMAYEVEYSDYADHGEILTDIKSPGRIVQKVGGKPTADLKIKKVDANNPYAVFPVPSNVKAARAQGGVSR
jgi:hypothetical protein